MSTTHTYCVPEAIRPGLGEQARLDEMTDLAERLFGEVDVELTIGEAGDLTVERLEQWMVMELDIAGDQLIHVNGTSELEEIEASVGLAQAAGDGLRVVAQWKAAA